jgi:hypothetical protein
MGVNNHLRIPATDDDGAEEVLDVQFRWGDVSWELEYRVGDKIAWNKAARPALADGSVEVRGLALANAHQMDLRYFAIRVDNDVIVSVREIEEDAYDAMGTSAG